MCTVWTASEVIGLIVVLCITVVVLTALMTRGEKKPTTYCD